MTVRFSVDNHGVASVVLARPEKRNAFNDEVIAELTRIFSGLDTTVRCVVISGDGPVFCAGGDLNWMKSMAGFSREENVADATRLAEMFAAIDGCGVPVIGRVHGAVMAGATGVVACCDTVVAAEGTKFAFTEVRLGLVPATIAPFVVRKVGYSFARSAFLSAEVFDAQRALEVGLIHQVVPEADLDAAVAKRVDGCLNAAPGALRATRALLEGIHGRDPAEVRQTTAEAIADARVSDEGQAGITAFFDKQKPPWATPDN